MGRDLKFYLPDVVYEVTCVAFQERCLLRPGTEANDRIAGCIGRAQAIYPSVRLYGVVALPERLSWLVSSPTPEDIPAFIGYVSRRISSELGSLYDWPGSHWDGPMRAAPILDDAQLQERFEALLAQGVEQNLVEHALDWPGVTCLPSLLGRGSLVGTWFNRDLETRMKRRANPPPGETWQIRYRVYFDRLPGHEHRTEAEYAAFVAELLERVERRARDARRKTGARCVGVERLLAQDPHRRAGSASVAVPPRCHASSQASRRAFRAFLARLTDWYRRSAELVASGFVDVLFPPGSFPPRYPHRARFAAPPTFPRPPSGPSDAWCT